MPWAHLTVRKGKEEGHDPREAEVLDELHRTIHIRAKYFRRLPFAGSLRLRGQAGSRCCCFGTRSTTENFHFSIDGA